MAMTREQMDEFDRIMMGMPARQAGNAPVRAMTPTPESMDPMLRPEGTAGGPVVSYSLDDIRRFLGIGGRPAMSPAEMADAAQMYANVPPPRPAAAMAGPSATPMGAQEMPAPMPRPVPRAAPRPRLPVMQGLPTDESQFVPVAPGAMPAATEAMRPPIPPVPLANPNRVDPQMLARALMRAGRVPLGNEAVPLPPGSEMQVGPAPLGGMPVEAQADQTMRSVSRINPQSFGQRYRAVMTR